MANPFSLMGGPSYFAGDDDDAFSGGPSQLMGADPAVAAYAAQAAASNAGKIAAQKQALANQLAGGSDRIRYQPLAIDSVAVIATTVTATIVANPQKPFRAERLVVNGGIVVTSDAQVVAACIPSGNLICAFVINSILVGVDNQTLSTQGALPGAMFAPNAVQTSLKFTTAIPGIGMSVNVTNTDSVSHRFLGALLGTALG